MADKYGFDGGHIEHFHVGDSGSGIEGSRLAGSHADRSNNHGSSDHLASIYDSHTGQFETVVPFLQQGLERGERCLYVADDNTEEEVLEALQERGIDVSEALESGALSIHTKSDIYLRTGEFEPDAMFELLQEILAKAKGEEGYTGLRGTAEMTWALDELGEGTRTVEEAPLSDEVGMGKLAKYEALLNNLLSGDDYLILCQYNRRRFPEEVLSDVIRTHPFVVYNGTICGNHHYYPPEKFFRESRPLLDIDRTVERLLRRTRTQEKLQERERYQSKMFEITADTNRSFEEKLDSLFDLGCEYFGLKLGGLARIDQRTDLLEVEAISREHSHLAFGKQYPLSETYFRRTAKARGAVAISDSLDREGEGALDYLQFGVRAYIGTMIELDEALDRIIFFISNEPRETPFSESERTFHHLMSQWVEQELRKKRSEEDLKELTQTLEERVEMRTRQVQKLTAKVTLAEQMEEAYDLTVQVEAEGLAKAETQSAKAKAADQSLESLVFRLTKELLFNVVKHAETGEAFLYLEEGKDQLRVVVADEGEGFDPSTLEDEDGGGHGLVSVRERIEMIGGSFEVESAPGEGTRITIVVPWQTNGTTEGP